LSHFLIDFYASLIDFMRGSHQTLDGVTKDIIKAMEVFRRHVGAQTGGEQPATIPHRLFL
jgi:hypothetical protein